LRKFSRAPQSTPQQPERKAFTEALIPLVALKCKPQPALKKQKKPESPPPLVSTPPAESCGTSSHQGFPLLEAQLLQAVDLKLVTEIYDWNFHMQPRVLDGILTKSYFGSETYVLKHLRTVLSVATVKMHTLPDDTFLEIILCATNIFHRNCGAASLLVALLIEKARVAACDRIIAWVGKAARRFWVKQGFDDQKLTPAEVGYFRRASLVFDNYFPTDAKAEAARVVLHPAAHAHLPGHRDPGLHQWYHLGAGPGLAESLLAGRRPRLSVSGFGYREGGPPTALRDKGGRPMVANTAEVSPLRAPPQTASPAHHRRGISASEADGEKHCTTPPSASAPGMGTHWPSAPRRDLVPLHGATD